MTPLGTSAKSRCALHEAALQRKDIVPGITEDRQGPARKRQSINIDGVQNGPLRLRVVLSIPVFLKPRCDLHSKFFSQSPKLTTSAPPLLWHGQFIYI